MGDRAGSSPASDTNAMHYEVRVKRYPDFLLFQAENKLMDKVADLFFAFSNGGFVEGDHKITEELADFFFSE